jgi:hypothetical protein
MDRRSFLIAPAAVSLWIATRATARADMAAVPDALRLDVQFALSTPGSLRNRHLHDHAMRVLARAEQASGGRMRLDAPSAGAGEAPTTRPDVLITEVRAVVALDPLLALFDIDPLAPHPVIDHVAWLSIGGGQMLWDEAAARTGYKPLLIGVASADASAPRAIALMILRDIWAGLSGDLTALLEAVAAEAVQRNIVETIGLGVMAQADFPRSHQPPVATTAEAEHDRITSSRAAWRMMRNPRARS